MNPEHIERILSLQKFYDFYNTGDYAEHIQGANDCKSREEILEQIRKMFQSKRIIDMIETFVEDANESGHFDVQDACVILDEIYYNNTCKHIIEHDV